MAYSIFSDNVSIFFSSMVQGLREYLFHPIGFLQVGAIGVAYLIAWLFAAKTRQYLEKDIDKVKAHMRLVLGPVHFAIVLKYLFWLMLVWFCQGLFKELGMPVHLLHMALNLVVALLVIRFASFYIKSIFWSRLVYATCLLVIFLRIFKLWESTVHLLDSMTIRLGKLSISMWGLTEAITVFILLGVVAGTANRFIAHWLTTCTHLTYSDRTLIQRAIRAAMVAAVILISLRAAGIHLATVLVTGGAIGFAVGMGLQKIGSNLVSGVTLLLRKPIRQGDVIALEKSFIGADYGWITQIGSMYVHVATRNGSSALIPNEVFVTQKIENLSSSDNHLRLDMTFGISYESDLKKAIALAIHAATSIDRILKVPEPKCLVREFGDSAVQLQLRVWINDPKKGIANFKDAVLLAVWDSFQANGIEFAFPQRDLHIKNAVPLRINKGGSQPIAKDTPESTGKKAGS